MVDLFETDAKKIIEGRIAEELDKFKGQPLDPYQLQAVVQHVMTDLHEPPEFKIVVGEEKNGALSVSIKPIPYL
jgi:hypothetical protein